MAATFNGQAIQVGDFIIGERHGLEVEGTVTNIRPDVDDSILIKSYFRGGSYRDEQGEYALLSLTLEQVKFASTPDVEAWEGAEPEELWDCEHPGCGAKQQTVKSKHVANRQDPTLIITLACGHILF